MSSEIFNDCILISVFEMLKSVANKRQNMQSFDNYRKCSNPNSSRNAEECR